MKIFSCGLFASGIVSKAFGAVESGGANECEVSPKNKLTNERIQCMMHGSWTDDLGVITETERCWLMPRDDYQDTSGDPVPLVIEMHGIGGCAEFLDRKEEVKPSVKRWTHLAKNDENIFLVRPQALGDLWKPWDGPYSTNPRDPNEAIFPEWDRTGYNLGACCMGAQNLAGGRNIDDVGFITEMVKKLVAENNIDPTRIYMTGSSNGCGLAQLMAYKYSDWVAGVGCHSMYLVGENTTMTDVDEAPVGYLPTPIIEVHGKKDSVVGYEKGVGQLKYIATGAVENFDRWARINGCSGTPSFVDDSTTYTAPYTWSMYNECSGGVKVGLITLTNADHGDIFYGDSEAAGNIHSVKMAYDVIKEYSKPNSSMKAFASYTQTTQLEESSSSVALPVVLGLAGGLAVVGGLMYRQQKANNDDMHHNPWLSKEAYNHQGVMPQQQQMSPELQF